MSSLAGTRLGAYDVKSLIGEGGMGAVYRGRDTRLDRDVAIKVLLESFAHDADRLARFEREARLLASLNHPHIAQVYGLEVGDTTSALVMEPSLVTVVVNWRHGGDEASNNPDHACQSRRGCSRRATSMRSRHRRAPTASAAGMANAFLGQRSVRGLSGIARSGPSCRGRTLSQLPSASSRSRRSRSCDRNVRRTRGVDDAVRMAVG